VLIRVSSAASVAPISNRMLPMLRDLIKGGIGVMSGRDSGRDQSGSVPTQYKGPLHYDGRGQGGSRIRQ
jgi:hypothetical protein